MRLSSTVGIGTLAIVFSGSLVVFASSEQSPRSAHQVHFTADYPQTRPGGQSEKRNRGIELYQQNKFEEAAKILRSAVKEDKTDHEAWYHLGLAFLAQPAKIKDAAKAFETALSIRPQFAAAHTGLAYTSLRRNKSSVAIREARAALSIDPTLAEPHYIIGVVHINARDPEEALLEASEAIRLGPEFALAHLLKSQALIAVYAKKSMELLRPAGSSPLTPEQRAQRRQRRLDQASILKEAAEGMQTYLKLNPNASPAEIWREQVETLKFYASYPREKTPGDDAPVFGDDVTIKARVLSKPEPTYTESARQAQVEGIVVLRAVFAADGTVRHILVLAGLPNGLTEAAIRAARMIKFTPATSGGHPVSMFIQLEYSFNLY